MTGIGQRPGVAMALVALMATGAALLGIDARATYGAQVTSDEPQYLLTAISLAEDQDLDISDELAERRFLPFHEIDLDPQTTPLDDTGRRVSPHDPLLPAVLAVPMHLGGWRAAKATLALISGMVAAATLRLAVDRFGAARWPSAAVVGGLFAAPPLAVYGTQVYPAMPAALCVTIGLLAATRAAAADSPRPALGRLAVVGAVVALPWLSVKYVPLAGIIAVTDLARRWRPGARGPWGTVVAYAIAGVAYLAAHQVLYGGWTVYASGDHFVDGEWLVIGSDPNYLARTRRLIGLIVDRNFGLAAWTPTFLAAPAVVTWLTLRRPQGWGSAVGLVAAGWAVATWVALTMHGWWWPGRQVVPVLPIVVAALAAAASRGRRRLSLVLLTIAVGVASWLWLAFETTTGRRTLIVDFADTAAPWYRIWRLALPDHQRMAVVDVTLTAAWTIAVLSTMAVVARHRRRHDAARPTATAGHRADRPRAANSEGDEPDRDRLRSSPDRRGHQGPTEAAPLRR